ncbi:unnamed protein product (macronuclear) [Paramecium tetraurelia]|uniref:Uncharacterized protein n=1 Tax=Paramecium tetraurelia TaxID=5888 RepID=A0CA27_PARTE|nr:uncharacterized protein GSPATT00036423001 [Paramecium tetraurelia]CAK67644.1 unnamed protein product [Paramecium tetraurelia]|eukprot:XP_001435041.1 hypothetical protein (macronuclear) [Paramecium tetraurelia strain d4-2]
MSQFQQAVFQLRQILRKNSHPDIFNSMLSIIFSDDFSYPNQEQIAKLEKAFFLNKDTAIILQILLTSFENNTFTQIEDYINLLLYRIDSHISLLESNSSSSSSPARFYTQYQVTERIKKEQSINKKIKKQTKNQHKKTDNTSIPKNNNNNQ